MDLVLQVSRGGKGRITLIGDAAHVIHPTDGQGGSIAFEDAAVHSRLLKIAAAAAGLDDTDSIKCATPLGTDDACNADKTVVLFRIQAIDPRHVRLGRSDPKERN